MALFQGKNDEDAETGGILLAELLSTARAYREANRKR